MSLLSFSLSRGVVLILLAGAMACGKKEEPAPEANVIKVKVAPAERHAFRPDFEFPAIIESIETAQIYPRVQARISAQNVLPGKYVKKGEVLVRLEPEEFALALTEAESSLNEAVAAAEQANANYQRAKELRPQGYISGQDFDKAKALALAADANVTKYNSVLERAQLDMDYTVIRAPFSGKVGHPNYAVGDTVTPNSPKPIVEMVKLDPIYALAHVDQKLYTRFIALKQRLRQQGEELPDMEAYIILPGGTPYPFRGQFVSWDSTATATRGTIAGRVLFDNPEGVLLPEENVSLRGKLQGVIDRILIPQKAVSQDQQGHYIFMVNDQGKVERKNIEVGVRAGENWAVLSGLEEGQKIIIEGLQKVSSGDSVEMEIEAMSLGDSEDERDATWVGAREKADAKAKQLNGSGAGAVDEEYDEDDPGK